MDLNKIEVTNQMLNELASGDLEKILRVIMGIRAEAVLRCQREILSELGRELDSFHAVESSSILGAKTSKQKFEDLTQEEWIWFYMCQVAYKAAGRMREVVSMWPESALGRRGVDGFPREIVEANKKNLLREIMKAIDAKKVEQ